MTAEKTLRTQPDQMCTDGIRGIKTRFAWKRWWLYYPDTDVYGDSIFNLKSCAAFESHSGISLLVQSIDS